MFTSIRVGNFKRFQRCDIDLRPINIFVGPNNSGKSSLISALRLVVQTLDSYDDQVPLLLNGPLGDFGTFKDIVYRNHRGRPLDIGFTVSVPDLHSFGPPTESTATRVAFDIVFKYNTEERQIHAESIVVKADGEHLISLRYSKDSRRHNVERLGRTVVPPALKSVLSREFRVRHFVPIPMGAKLGGFEPQDRDSPYRTFLNELYAGRDADVTRMLTRLGARLPRVIAATDYLGPLRTPPARTYLFSGERRKRIGIAGENMTSVLATSEGRKSKARPNNVSLSAQMNAWLQRAEMAKGAVLDAISDRHFELRVQNFFTGENQNIADVGYGHSQVLPFLAGGYALPRNSAYMAEQPELHLHPRAQAGLADFIVEMFHKGTQTLIETHSEHLILRLQQHIAKGEVPADSARIFYIHNDLSTEPVQPNATGSNEVCVIDIDASGQFKTPWPNGFFPEKLAESRELARLRMNRLAL